MRFKILFITLSALMIMAPKDVQARDIFVNGLNLKNVDLTNQLFTGCTVKIDAKGNVHIKVPGIELKAKDDASSGSGKKKQAVEDESAKEFYLVSFTNRPGATQYDVEVFINGKFVRRIRSTKKQVTMKVSNLLKKGKNEIIFVCKKNIGKGGRVSESPMDYMRVVLGKGFETKGRLVIKTSLAEVKRTAKETKEQITVKKTLTLK